MKRLLPVWLAVAMAGLTGTALAGGPLALLAQVPRGSGFTLNYITLIVAIALFLGWTALSHWVNEDAQSIRADAGLWNSAVLFLGLVGVLQFFIVENFVASIGIYVAFVLGPVVAFVYIAHNPNVADNRKLLTPEHFERLAARFGMRFDKDDVGEEELQLTFVAKTSTGRREDAVSKAEGSRGYGSAKELMYDAIQSRVTDIHLEPSGEQLSVRYRIDGILHAAEPFDRPTGDALLNVYKVLGAMDITERRKPQDGSFGVILGEDKEYDIRVATSGSSHGEKMVLRILDGSQDMLKLERVGLNKKLRERMSEIIEQPHGMVLCCGPTGAGKSTTLYACLNTLDRYMHNVITIEDPIEYRLDAITQIEINTKAGQTFAGSLRSILRQDPDVILVGEIRDAETATIACQAAQTGHLVFSSVHANDAVTTVFRLLDLGVDSSNLATALSAVIAQRLVRVLCKKCRQPYVPSPELLSKLGIKSSAGIEAFHRAQKGGCEHCSTTGYFGRTGIFELLTVSEPMRDMIRDRTSLKELKTEARRNGLELMRNYGIRLVARGVTSVEELKRVAT
ncbi:Type II secretion system protein E [Planctomycetes bacterium Pan216]|uniref:Type II secretion system protein E n=1 Tax=Kolteria novifilia TaxID=2527975 RepID=A0A518AYU0_9BACT|nr:Type II secretion system protein E [Planctomycetes bacterium Pan216]